VTIERLVSPPPVLDRSLSLHRHPYLYSPPGGYLSHKLGGSGEWEMSGDPIPKDRKVDKRREVCEGLCVRGVVFDDRHSGFLVSE